MSRARSIVGCASLLLLAGCVDDRNAPALDAASDAALDGAFLVADAQLGRDLSTLPDFGPPAGGLPAPIEIVPGARGLFVAVPRFTRDAGALMLVDPESGAATLVAGGDRHFSVGPHLASDGDWLFFAAGDENGWRIFRMSRAGGPPVALAAGQPDTFAVDATFLYWSEGKVISRVPILGGAPDPFAALALAYARRLAVDADFIYFTQGDPHRYDKECFQVKRSPLAGGSATVVVDKLFTPWWIAVDGEALYVMDEGHLGTDCLGTDGGLLKVPLDGKSPHVWLAGVVGPDSLLLRDGYAYYLEGGTECDAGQMLSPVGKVNRVRTDGNTAPELLVAGQVDPFALALDDRHTYWGIAIADGQWPIFQWDAVARGPR